MVFNIHALFLYFSFNFVIKEVVLPPPVCFCVCVPLKLFSSGICLWVPLVLGHCAVCYSLCAASDCLPIDRNFLSIVDFKKKKSFIRARL